MKKVITLILALLITTGIQSRPKVAVVLSGGGAKGSAHVSALKVIEEAGIPIDIIVGTSMGSLVGGLYSAGYSTQQLDSILRAQNWKHVLMNLTDRNSKLMAHKMTTDRYTFSVFYENNPAEILEGGILKGEQVGQLLSDLTVGLHDSISYNKLKIPFACVATDIVTGEEIVMHSGILAESMRASMAIPGVFSPVRKGDKVLVDGGLVNNYPVDVARQMGADIVIGVDVTGSRRNAEHTKSALDVLAQTLDVVCKNKYEENVAATDVHIKVNVGGFSAASFTKEAIDSIMKRGEQAARDKWQELVITSTMINNTVVPNAYRNTGYTHHAKPHEEPVGSIIHYKDKRNMLGVGFRFDNEELASLLIGASYQFHAKNKLRATIEGRLGKRMSGLAAFKFNAFEKVDMTASYSIGKNDLKVYDLGSLAANFNYTHHVAVLNFTRGWFDALVDIGAMYTSRNFGQTTTTFGQEDFTLFKKMSSLDIFCSISFDNQDNNYFPTKGIKWFVLYNFSPHNRFDYRTDIFPDIPKEDLSFISDKYEHSVIAHWEIAIPLKKFVLKPYISGRYTTNNNENPMLFNMIGGIKTMGHYMPQQLPFAGVDYIQIMDNENFIGIGAVELRYNFYKKHNLYLIGNYGYCKNFDDNTGNDNYFPTHMAGWAFGYSYRSIIGPLSAYIDWSNITHKVGGFINIGYMF